MAPTRTLLGAPSSPEASDTLSERDRVGRWAARGGNRHREGRENRRGHQVAAVKLGEAALPEWRGEQART